MQKWVSMSQVFTRRLRSMGYEVPRGVSPAMDFRNRRRRVYYLTEADWHVATVLRDGEEKSIWIRKTHGQFEIRHEAP